MIVVSFSSMNAEADSAAGADLPFFGMSAPLSGDSEGRIHHDKTRRDVCATHGTPVAEIGEGDDIEFNVVATRR